jgi:chromatin remodeling complex protein RSC6
MESTTTLETQAEIVVESTNVNSQLKDLMTTLTSQSNLFKTMVSQLKIVIKEVDKQSKDLEKFRNKKNRSKNQRKESSQQSGITKPVAISEELSLFLGVQPGTLVPRNEVTKGVSEYIRTHELFDPANRQRFLLDLKPEGLKLKKLLGEPTEGITYFNLQRYLKPHYLTTPKDDLVKVSIPEPVKEVPKEEVIVTGDEVVEKKKKKILVKKVKTATEQLNEEV